MRYLFNIFYSIDQLFNAFLGGYPDETLSSRMGKLIAKDKCLLCRGICWFLSKLQKDHCRRSVEEDEGEKD